LNANSAEIPELSIVIPCLNEETTLGACIRAAREGAESSGVAAYEIVVADNGSSDDSRGVAEAAGARVVSVKERGYGAALRGGISAANGRYVIMADADGSYDLSSLDGFIEKLRRGTALVMGSRFAGQIEPGAMPWLNRHIGNPLLTFLGRLFFRINITDFHCGMRAFDRSSILNLNLTTDGMEFASEMVIKAALAGLSMDEVPITLYPDKRTRPPHLRPWRDGWRHLRFMLVYSPRWVFLYPGFALIIVGIPLASYLLFARLRIGALTLDVHSLLATMTAIALGTQLVTLGLFARLYASRAGLLPPSPSLDRYVKLYSLEIGLAVGLLLGLVGIGLYGYSFYLWGSRSFGPIIEYQHTLRLVIGGTGSLLIGTQIFFSSFVFSLIAESRE
jgi:glycosyltransferase involved in cell wall biosynthesis